MAGFSQQDAMDYLTQRGMSHVAAAGLIGNLAAESGMDPGIEERTPNRYGTRGYGLAQWAGSRRDGLVQFAADTGGRAADPHTQMDYLLHELQGPEKRAGDMLAAATTPEEANAAALAFLRPSGWTSKDPTQSNQYATRLAGTTSLLGGNSDTPQTAQPAPPQQAAPVLAAAQQPDADPYGAAVNTGLKGFASLLGAPAAGPTADAPVTPRQPTPQAAPQMRRPTRPAAPTGLDAVGQRLAALGGLWRWS